LCLLLPYIAITEEVDALYYFARPVLEPIWKRHKGFEIVVTTIRYTLIVFYTVDVCRIVGCVFVITFLLQRYMIGCLKNIEIEAMSRRSRNSQNFTRFLGFQYYLCFRIILRLSEYAPDAIGLFTMTGGGIVIIIANFTTVKLSHVIPMPTFLLFPCVAIMCPIFGATGLKVGAQCYEISKHFKREWLRPVIPVCGNGSNRKVSAVSAFWKRKCLTLKPSAYNVGVNDIIFCRIDSLTSLNYWYEILYNSITAILSIPT